MESLATPVQKTSTLTQEHLSHDGILLETDILYLTSKNSLRQSSHCTLVCCMYSLKGQSGWCSYKLQVSWHVVAIDF